jgi:putative proteasome-type protease
LTYCLALRLDEGLVFVSDTRTNAGVDNVSTYRKLHVINPGRGRVFVIQSAGSLATTQQVLDRIRTDLEAGDDRESLASVHHLYEAALYIGRLSRDVAHQHRDALREVGADGTATFILGGQVGAEPSDLLLVYPEGNYIRASDDRPFLQIGESKYGKFLLELSVEVEVDLVKAIKIALGSMLSTARANLSVGPPYDVGVYRNGTHDVVEFRIKADSPFIARLRQTWERHLLAAVADLPAIMEEDLDYADDDHT